MGYRDWSSLKVNVIDNVTLLNNVYPVKTYDQLIQKTLWSEISFHFHLFCAGIAENSANEEDPLKALSSKT